MRTVCTYFPVLLRPAVLEGIGVVIELTLRHREKAAYVMKLRHLERLREEIEGHTVKNW